ncbi:hypothetical protein ILUMI_04380 [Ignelater luminosus]|uniref:Transporter n=1 Tax=Ignelater luminosus TaxID=2038154 RepID=A0A8K0DEW3_IGNLU|nr:hypothetical protein ILUMI_04380 [Ignelater luminosus]
MFFRCSWVDCFITIGFDNPVFEPEKGDHTKTVQNGNGPVAITIEKEENRAQWGHSMEFLMSCIAMSVGLGNIWRFPFIAYQNGGGAFLIPYIIVLIVIGRPMYYMDMGLGQFSSKGNVKMFASLFPAFKGVGYSQLVGCGSVATYYCAIMGITLFYLFNSFTSNLPWSECNKEWEIKENITCIASSEKGGSMNGSLNALSSSELWFTREVLKEKTQIDDGLGTPDWKLTLCLLLAWIITAFVSIRGVKSSGKVSYFLALFPYVIMFALLVRAVTLEGSAEGILYFIRPDWDKLLTAEVWYAAVTQCFFSLNVGGGAIIMYSSYNNFEHNINRDAIVVTSIDTLTSLLAGFTIFGILGNLAYELGVPVKDVIKSGGSGLAFISYPEAIAKFQQVPWLFSILFFLMLLVLGIGSLVAVHGIAITAITDTFPSAKSWQVSTGTALVGFLIGLVYCTPGGQFILTLVDHYAGTIIIFLSAVIEVYVVMWWYGVENFCNDMEFMLKQKVGVYWRITWGVITPISLVVIFIYFLSTLTRLTYGHYEIPEIALVCGWLIVVANLTQILYFIIRTIYKHRQAGFPQMICDAFHASKWGPHSSKRMEEWKKFKKQRDEEVRALERSWLKHKLLFLIGR